MSLQNGLLSQTPILILASFLLYPSYFEQVLKTKHKVYPCGKLIVSLCLTIGGIQMSFKSDAMDFEQKLVALAI